LAREALHLELAYVELAYCFPLYKQKRETIGLPFYF
jgi:hypothetical protein